MCYQFGMEYQGPERRGRRSEYVSEALSYQLAAIVERHEIDGLLLADPAGKVWAASSKSLSDQSISAQAAYALEPDRNKFVQLCPQPDPLTARQLIVNNTTLYLVAHSSGFSVKRSRYALLDATRGVKRILGSLAN